MVKPEISKYVIPIDKRSIMQIEKVLLKDKLIDDLLIVDFIVHCLGQIGAFQAIPDSLKANGYSLNANYAYTALNVTRESMLKLLDLKDICAKDLKDICQNIINTLVDYQDLEIIMCITKEEAYSQITKI